MSSAGQLPALLGGPAVRPQGPPDWPAADPEILAALQATYQDGSWGKYQGGRVEQLEQELARLHEVDCTLTCGSGTFAVELALRALQVGPDDEVILSAYDYGGNFLGVHAVGAKPVLVDVDPDNWNLDPKRLMGAIGKATKAVIVSHLHGGIVPMREVTAVAEPNDLAVIEDAAQAPGAMVQGRRAGTWGDVGILSFGGSKLLTAGRGGAILTRWADVQQRARVWLNRGNVVNPLSELQAAVLLPQLAKLDRLNAQRTASVTRLTRRLEGVPGIQPLVNHATESQAGYYKLGLQFDAATFGLTRTRFVAAVRAEGIAIDEGFRALHVGRSPNRFTQRGPLAEAEAAHRGCLVLHHPILLGTPNDIDEIALAIRKVYAHRDQLRG